MPASGTPVRRIMCRSVSLRQLAASTARVQNWLARCYVCRPVKHPQQALPASHGDIIPLCASLPAGKRKPVPNMLTLGAAAPFPTRPQQWHMAQGGVCSTPGHGIQSRHSQGANFQKNGAAGWQWSAYTHSSVRKKVSEDPCSTMSPSSLESRCGAVVRSSKRADGLLMRLCTQFTPQLAPLFHTP